MNDIIDQINGYAKMVHNIRIQLQDDFEKTFFFQINFSSVKKMIIAPREFYAKQKHPFKDETIEYGYYRLENINEIIPREKPINIHLEQKKR